MASLFCFFGGIIVSRLGIFVALEKIGVDGFLVIRFARGWIGVGVAEGLYEFFL